MDLTAEEKKKLFDTIEAGAKNNIDKDEKIIADYSERARTLQRNYLIMIGFALAFFLLFSLPYFSAEDSLKKNTEYKNTIDNAIKILTLHNRTPTTSLAKANVDTNKTITGLDKVRSDIVNTSLSFSSSFGTVKIGFTQILMFYPLALSIGFAIVCLQLTELMRYNNWVKSKRELLGNELDERSPGVIKAVYDHHVTLFLTVPFVMVVLSISSNLSDIFIVKNTDLAILYGQSGEYYKTAIPVLYAISFVVSVLFVYFVAKEFQGLTALEKGRISIEQKWSKMIRRIRGKFDGWNDDDKVVRTICVATIIIMGVVIGALLSLLFRYM